MSVHTKHRTETLPCIHRLSHIIEDVGKMHSALANTQITLLECVTTDRKRIEQFESGCVEPQMEIKYQDESSQAKSKQRLADFRHLSTAARVTAYTELEQRYIQQNSEFLCARDALDKALLQATIENSRLVHMLADSKGIHPYTISANHAAVLTFGP